MTDGTPAEITSWKSGRKHGMSTTFHQNGQKKIEGNYLYNQKDGIERYYFADGQLKIDGQYDNGKEEGIFRYYFFDGDLDEEILWRKGAQMSEEQTEKALEKEVKNINDIVE